MKKGLALLLGVVGVSGHGYITNPEPRQKRNNPDNKPNGGWPNAGWNTNGWGGVVVPGSGAYAEGEGNAPNLNSGIGGGLGGMNLDKNPATRHNLCGDTRVNDDYPGGPLMYQPTDIRGTYRAGGTMEVDVKITAYHAGWFEFRVCDNIDEFSQECLDKWVMEVDPSTPYFDKVMDYTGMKGIGHRNPGSTDDGAWYTCPYNFEGQDIAGSKVPASVDWWPHGTCCNSDVATTNAGSQTDTSNACSKPNENKERYVIEHAWPYDKTNYKIILKIPPALSCMNCVLQWTYQTANSRETYPETFWNCADIRILRDAECSPDDCGVCGGDGTSCAGCDGITNSGKVKDSCGVCDGQGASIDKCGVCDGDGSTCSSGGGGGNETPPPPITSGGIASWLTDALWDEMFPFSKGTPCKAKDIFNRQNFIQAVTYYPTFGRDATHGKREVAAFLGQISQETSGWWAGQPYAWGLCFKEEVACDGGCPQYSAGSSTYPAVAGKSYHGRGAIQITWNYNYGMLSQQLFNDKTVLLVAPERLAEDGVLAFRASLWFWMTAQSSKPSAHDVMNNAAQEECGCNRANGFGLTTNIINGGLECGMTTPQKVHNRVNYYKRYADILGVSYGINPDKPNLYCSNMKHYGQGSCSSEGTCQEDPTGGSTDTGGSDGGDGGDGGGSTTTRCGTNWADANSCSNSNVDCSGGAGCPVGSNCYANLDCTSTGGGSGGSDDGGGGGSSSTRCGKDWSTADQTCGKDCQSSADCPTGDMCYARVALGPCADVTDPCEGVTCANNGNCANGACNCVNGYTGATCATAPPVDACAGVNCGKGTCTGGKCDCTGTSYKSSDLTMTDCNEPDPVSLCEGVQCGANGECQAGYCVCSNGFTQTTDGQCTTPPPDLCQSNAVNCANGGTCAPTTGKCTCTGGFTGVTCTTAPPTGVCEGAAAYDARTVYNGGDEVAHNGKKYSAKWWTRNSDPTAGGPWKEEEDCGGGDGCTGTCCGAPAWQSNSEYCGGKEVKHSNNLYRSKWCNINKQPDENRQWQLIMKCSSTVNAVVPPLPMILAYKVGFEASLTSNRALVDDEKAKLAETIKEKYNLDTVTVKEMEFNDDTNTVNIVFELGVDSEAQANTVEEWLKRDAADGSLVQAMVVQGGLAPTTQLMVRSSSTNPVYDTIVTPNTTSSTDAPGGDHVNDGGEKKEEGINTGIVIAIVIGATILAIGITLMVVWKTGACTKDSQAHSDTKAPLTPRGKEEDYQLPPREARRNSGAEMASAV